MCDIEKRSNNFLNDDIIEYLRPLKPYERTAVLGFLAGMNPVITIQTGCPDEAAKIWNTKYKDLLIKSITALSKLLPINILAIEAAAKNVYIKRNNLSPLVIAFDTFKYFLLINNCSTEKEWEKGCLSEECNYITEMVSIFLNKYKSITDLPLDNYAIYNEFTKFIEQNERTLPVNYSVDRVRNISVDIIKQTKVIIDYQTIEDPMAFPWIISNEFDYDLLPKTSYSGSFFESPYIDTYNNIAVIYLKFKWCFEENISTSENISNESFDPVSNIFFSPELIDELTYNKKQRELEQELIPSIEAINDSFTKLEKLTAQYNNILNTGIQNVSLEEINFLINKKIILTNDLSLDQSYALESIGNIILKVIGFITTHINKIITIILAIIAAIFGLKKLLTGIAENFDKEADTLIKAKKEEINKIIKEMSEQKVTIPKANISKLINLLKEYEFDKSKPLNAKENLMSSDLVYLIIHDTPGYKAADIVKTMQGHLAVMHVVLSSMDHILVKEQHLMVVHQIESATNSIINEIKKEFYSDKLQTIQYTRKYLYEAIKQHNGYAPAPSKMLSDCTKEIHVQEDEHLGITGFTNWSAAGHGETDKLPNNIDIYSYHKLLHEQNFSFNKFLNLNIPLTSIDTIHEIEIDYVYDYLERISKYCIHFLDLAAINPEKLKGEYKEIERKANVVVKESQAIYEEAKKLFVDGNPLSKDVTNILAGNVLKTKLNILLKTIESFKDIDTVYETTVKIANFMSTMRDTSIEIIHEYSAAVDKAINTAT